MARPVTRRAIRKCARRSPMIVTHRRRSRASYPASACQDLAARSLSWNDRSAVMNNGDNQETHEKQTAPAQWEARHAPARHAGFMARLTCIRCDRHVRRHPRTDARRLPQPAGRLRRSAKRPLPRRTPFPHGTTIHGPERRARHTAREPGSPSAAKATRSGRTVIDDRSARRAGTAGQHAPRSVTR